jgi:hypothetical protein
MSPMRFGKTVVFSRGVGVPEEYSRAAFWLF